MRDYCGAVQPASGGEVPQVQAKKVYNSNGVRRGLLSGDMWFEQQAFRHAPSQPEHNESLLYIRISLDLGYAAISKTQTARRHALSCA